MWRETFLWKVPLQPSTLRFKCFILTLPLHFFLFDEEKNEMTVFKRVPLPLARHVTLDFNQLEYGRRRLSQSRCVFPSI